MNRKTAVLSVLFAAGVLLTGCAAREAVELPAVADYEIMDDGINDRKELKVGVVPGPYGDMFMEAIYPSLKELGYTAELVSFADYSSPNYYLAYGHIDLNMFQHYLYLTDSKFEDDMDLSAIAEIPTASMGIYSEKYTSIEDLEDDAYVSLPNDSTNLARALIILEDAGIIRLSQHIDKTKAHPDDIVRNPKNINLVPLPAHTLVQMLPEVDLAVINGNFVLDNGMRLSDALYTEQLGGYYYNIIAVRTEDLREQFVTDIIEILRSDAYRAVIEDQHRMFADFQRPLNFYESID